MCGVRWAADTGDERWSPAPSRPKVLALAPVCWRCIGLVLRCDVVVEEEEAFVAVGFGGGTGLGLVFGWMFLNARLAPLSAAAASEAPPGWCAVFIIIVVVARMELRSGGRAAAASALSRSRSVVCFERGVV